MAAAKAIRRIDDFLLDELILSIDQFDIDCAAKRGGKVKRSLGQVSFEPNRFSWGVNLPILVEVDFFLRELSKESLERSDNPR